MSEEYNGTDTSVSANTIGENLVGGLAVLSAIAVVAGLLVLFDASVVYVGILVVSLLVFALCWKILQVVRELNARVQRLEQQLD